MSLPEAEQTRSSIAFRSFEGHIERIGRSWEAALLSSYWFHGWTWSLPVQSLVVDLLCAAETRHAWVARIDYRALLVLCGHANRASRSARQDGECRELQGLFFAIEAYPRQVRESRHRTRLKTRRKGLMQLFVSGNIFDHRAAGMADQTRCRTTLRWSATSSFLSRAEWRATSTSWVPS